MLIGILISLIGCNSEVETSRETITSQTNGNTTQTTETGTLNLVANGEDFVRQGFVSKDEWQLNFNHVYVTLNEVKAYQTEPPFDPEKDTEIKSDKSVNLLDSPKTVDLAAGEATAPPITVIQTPTPPGNYNALSWQIVPGKENVSMDQTIVLEGIASKDNQKINFVIKLNEPLNYQCGDYVGEERKGILQTNASAEMETTFHFDHVFGDANMPPDDSLNKDALGFQPLAALAKDGNLDVNQKTLSQQLTSQDYQTFQNAIASLGHVGEGHCELVNNKSS